MSFWISYTQFCPPLMGKNGCIPSPIPFYVSKTCLNLHPSIRLHIFHVHVNLGFLNSICPCNFTCCNFFTHVWTLRPNVFHLPCWSRYLELNIACTFCLRIDIFLLPCSCRCFKLNFFHTWILKLDIFRIPCHSGCPKFSFVHFCNLIRDVPRIFFSSRYLKLNFPQT